MSDLENKTPEKQEDDFTVREIFDEAIKDDSWGPSEQVRKAALDVLYSIMYTM